MFTSLLKLPFSLLLLFLLLFTPPPSLSLSFSSYHYRTLLSLSHSLACRVANIRASRGDFEGSARAQSIAQKIEFLQGLDSWMLTYNLGWDSLKNYARRDMSFTDLASAVSDLNDLLRAVNELSPAPPSLSLSFSIYHYRTLLSISHSLAYRVAKLRASRRDFEGSARAQSIAQMIEFLEGLDSWMLTYNLGWDSLKNYDWREMSFTKFASAVSDLNELLRVLNELSGVDSDTEQASWVGRNYNRNFTVFRSLFDKLLKGPLREVVETMQKELAEGEFLRDCLELGTNDLKGLIQVLKDITLQYRTSTSGGAEL